MENFENSDALNKELLIKDEPYSLELANPNDIDEIMEIEREAFPSELQADKETMLKRMELHPEGFFVLRQNEKIAAFTASLIIDKVDTVEELEPSDEELSNPAGDTYYFRNLAVRKEYRRKGIGKVLVEMHVENARSLGMQHFRFTTAKRAEEYYKRLGFTMIDDYKPLHDSQESLWKIDL